MKMLDLLEREHLILVGISGNFESVVEEQHYSSLVVLRGDVLVPSLVKSGERERASS